MQEYDRKTLKVAVELRGEKNEGRGIIYLPKEIDSKVTKVPRQMYEYFLRRNGFIGSIEVETSKSIEELAETLEGKFDIKRTMSVPGIISQFIATKQQAKAMIIDLMENSYDY